MRVLILGGTLFLGRHLVTALRSREHTVVLFNRGVTDPHAFIDVETVRGDRTRPEDLQALVGRDFDAVIDTSGYAPRDVRAAASVLRDAGRYVFISSVSVYDLGQASLRETSPTLTLPAGEPLDAYDERFYGAYKVRCEEAAREFGDARTLVVRPGVIVGPYDPTDRFSYWVQRVARGGDVLAPGPATSRTQFIDARDLAAWVVAMLERNEHGTYNATGPFAPLSFTELLETCRAETAADAVFYWADAAFLERHDVVAWVDLPLWLPPESPDGGLLRTDITKARDAGLKLRPLSETIAATLSWLPNRAREKPWAAGLTPERECRLVTELRASSRL